MPQREGSRGTMCIAGLAWSLSAQPLLLWNMAYLREARVPWHCPSQERSSPWDGVPEAGGMGPNPGGGEDPSQLSPPSAYSSVGWKSSRQAL